VSLGTRKTKRWRGRIDKFWTHLNAAIFFGLIFLLLRQSETSKKGLDPVLVISTDLINDALRDNGCVVIPLTKQIHKANRNFRIRILEKHRIAEPNAPQVLKGDSVALTEQTRFISRDRMGDKRIARVTTLALGAVETGVKFVLGFL
jgi:mRNA-degrading endonuclease toxin of MazEF toxin-antitoxin module